MNVAYSEPLSFARGPDLKHRIALAPLTNQQANADGSLSDDEYQWLVARAVGGFSSVLTCAALVTPNGQTWPGQLGAYSDDHLPGLTKLATGLREAGATSILQMHHGGLRADISTMQGDPAKRELVAPWDDSDKGARALTSDEVNDIISDFVEAAVRADKAGFDGVEIHGAHGYLLCQFLDGEKNTRHDGWGGSLADRSRIFFEIISGIRERTRPDFQLGVRLSPERNGIKLTEAVQLSKDLLTTDELDFLDISLWDVKKFPYEEEHADRRLISYFTELDRGRTRFAVAGDIDDAQDIDFCMDAGADFVLVGTAGILQHDFASKCLADPHFIGLRKPVSRAHLESEYIGASFMRYLSTRWDDFVLD